MCELAEKGTDDRKIDQIVFLEHTCGAQDERECTLLKHIIMAEIRKSNAPAWVSEELEKKLDCRGCWNAQGRRPAARLSKCPVTVHYQ
jgi:hypothetical protein